MTAAEMRVLIPRVQMYVQMHVHVDLELYLELEPALDRLATCESSGSFREPCGRSLGREPWPRHRLRRRFFVTLECYGSFILLRSVNGLCVCARCKLVSGLSYVAVFLVD